MFELNYLIDTKTTADICLFTYIVFYYDMKTLNVWTRDEVVVVLLIRDRKQIPLSGSVAKMFDIYWAMVWCGGGGWGCCDICVVSRDGAKRDVKIYTARALRWNPPGVTTVSHVHSLLCITASGCLSVFRFSYTKLMK